MFVCDRLREILFEFGTFEPDTTTQRSVGKAPEIRGSYIKGEELLSLTLKGIFLTRIADRVNVCGQA